MDIFFSDPSKIPLPPEEIRIKQLRAKSWYEGERIHVYLEVDPFQQRPNADISIRSSDNDFDVLAQTSIIGSMTRIMEVNLHLRAKPHPGQYILSAVIYYSQDLAEQDQPETPPLQQPDLKNIIVDKKEIYLTL
jgi:hypothetical protein